MAAALPVIAVIGTVVSAGVGIAGSIIQGQAAAKQARAAEQAAAYRAQVAENNAQISRDNQKIAQENARATEAAGAAKADQESIKARQLIGAQKSAAAAAGVDINSGSALDIRAGTAGQAMLTDLNIHDDTNRRASAYRQQAAGLGEQGANFDIEADAARTAGAAAGEGVGAGNTASILGGVGALAQGAAKTTSLIGEYQRTGVSQKLSIG